MPRLKKPQTRYELFKKVLLMWYTAEYDNVKAYTFDRNEKYSRKQKLKERYDEYLQMWGDLRI